MKAKNIPHAPIDNWRNGICHMKVHILNTSPIINGDLSLTVIHI
jgi:hypothetical protein